MAVAVFHTFYHAAVDLAGRHARFPVLGVDALAHVEIVLFARLYQRQQLVAARWVAVGIVGGAEEQRGVPRYALDEQAREPQLHRGVPPCALGNVGVVEGVVAYHVAAVVHLAHDGQVLLDVDAHHEEGGVQVPLVEDVEHLGRPSGVGAVVEGEQQVLAAATAKLLQLVGRGQDDVVFGSDENVGVVHVDVASAVAWRAYEVEDLALAYVVGLVAAVQVLECAHGQACCLALDQVAAVERPQAVVLGAQTPHGKAGQPVVAPEAHGVEVGGGIVEVHLVFHLPVVVVGIAQPVAVLVVDDVVAAVGSPRDGVVIRQALVVVALGCPVVAVGGHAEHDFLVGYLACDVVDASLDEVLARDVARGRERVVLVVGHEKQIVGVLGQLAHVIVLVVGHDVLGEIEAVAVQGVAQLAHKGGEMAVVAFGKLLKVEVDAHKVVLLAQRHELIDECLRELAAVQHARDAAGVELAVPGVGEHGHDGHACLAHERESLAVDSGFGLEGRRVEKYPLGQHEVHLGDALLERGIGLRVPVHIEAGTQPGRHGLPRVDVLVHGRAFLAGIAVVFLDVLPLPLHIAVVGLFGVEKLAVALVLLRELVLLHERLLGQQRALEAVVEGESRSAVEEEHCDKCGCEHNDEHHQCAYSEFKLVPARPGVGLEYLLVHNFPLFRF